MVRFFFGFFFFLSNAFPILLHGLITSVKPRESTRVPSGIKDHTLNWAGFEVFFKEERRYNFLWTKSCLNIKQWNVVAVSTWEGEW